MLSLSSTIQRRISPAPSPDSTPPAPPTHAKNGPLRLAPLQSDTWTTERLEKLKRAFDAGLSCSKIAGEIGVSRNAVIGKLHRLGLKRPRDVIPDQLARARAERRENLKSKQRVSLKRVLERGQPQPAGLAFKFSEPKASIDIQPINEGRGRSLLELGPRHCRWPSGTPGAEDFCYCGHDSFEGFPYCLGHASIAYRAARRPSASYGR